MKPLPHSSAGTTLGGVGHRAELTLVAWVLESGSRGMSSGEPVCPLPAVAGRRASHTPRMGMSGDLALVTQVQESGLADHLSYHPVPDPGL